MRCSSLFVGGVFGELGMLADRSMTWVFLYRDEGSGYDEEVLVGFICVKGFPFWIACLVFVS